jgi:hypothetical protein
MTVEALLALILAHKWIAASSILIGAIVRLVKSDTILPVDVPAKWRPLLAIVLGQVAAVLEHLAAGASWGTAVANGVIASVIAILGHEWIVERLLGDRAMPIPGLTRKSPAPASRWDAVDPDAPTPNVDVPVVDVVVPDDQAKKS